MAKITLLPENRKTEDTMAYILGTMRVRKITQAQIADHLCITRKTFYDRIHNGTLTYTDLLQIFSVLDLPQEKIVEIMTLKG